MELAAPLLGTTDIRIERIAGSGSARQYLRVIAPGRSVVACVSGNIKENLTFIALARYLRARGLPVALILSVNSDASVYLQEDLGSVDLLGFLHQTRLQGETAEKKRTDVLAMTVRRLVEFQRLPEDEWMRTVEFEPLGSALIRFDCNYAVEHLIRPSGAAYDACRLDGEFRRLEDRLLALPCELWGLMYRDFQSRNIMLREESGKTEPWLIDFQSARNGPGIYDLVSFAWQARAGFSAAERELIVDLYCRELESHVPGCTAVVKDNVRDWAVFRVIQTLGAYGLRGLKEGKRHFVESIPPALHNLEQLLENEGTEYPELRRIVGNMGRNMTSFL